MKEEYNSYARPSHEVDQYNIRKQNLGGGKEKGYGGGRKSGSFDDEESTPAGEGGYGRKKYVRNHSYSLYLESYIMFSVDMHVCLMCLLVHLHVIKEINALKTYTSNPSDEEKKRIMV